MKQKINKSQKRQPNQRKVVQPGKKSSRGIAENPYGELKQRHCYSITPTCHSKLQDIGQELECSASEVLERLSRIADQCIHLLLSEETERQSSKEPNSYGNDEILDC